MSKKYFLKDKKAIIYRKKDTRSSNGGNIKKLQPISSIPLWCFTQNLSGAITDNQLIIMNEETRQFVFNYLQDIEQGYCIKYRDKWYEITRTYNTGDYNDETVVFVKNISPPNETDILPFES